MFYIIAFVSAISGFLFGFDEGIISGVLHTIREEFQLSDSHTGIMMGLLPFGALLAACISGRLADLLGRLRVLILISILFSIGTSWMLLASSFTGLCIARVLLGISIGMSVVVTPLYIAETAPAKIRGKLVTFFQLAITLGILSAYLINLFLAGRMPWRVVFAIGLVPSTALFVGSLFLSESPRWLYIKGKTKEAHEVLLKLYGSKYHSEKIEEELNVVRSFITKGKEGSWRELFSSRTFPSLALGMGLFLFQQISGINVVIYYAPIIFSELQLGDLSTQLLATVGLGTVNVLMTFVAMGFVERIGRRRFLISGFIGAAFFLGSIALLSKFEGPLFQTLSAFCLFFYIAVFAASLGPMPYILMSEVFPLKARGPGMSLSAATNWAFNTIVVASFPTLLSVFGISWVFLLYACACLLGLLFSIRYVPETKGKSLEEIEEYLHADKPLRYLGRK